MAETTAFARPCVKAREFSLAAQAGPSLMTKWQFVDLHCSRHAFLATFQAFDLLIAFNPRANGSVKFSRGEGFHRKTCEKLCHSRSGDILQ